MFLELLGAPLGQAPAFLTNIRLGWKDLTMTNTPAYYIGLAQW